MEREAMTERADNSREKLHAAIRARGWWMDFAKRVEELAGGGRTLAEAWQTAGDEFAERLAPDAQAPETPAPEANAATEAQASAPAIPRDPDAKAPSYLQDVEWVFTHLHDDGATADDAPSSGAWGLLERARVDPSCLDAPLMLLAKRQLHDEERAIPPVRRKTAAELERLIRRLLSDDSGDHERTLAEVAADDTRGDPKHALGPASRPQGLEPEPTHPPRNE